MRKLFKALTVAALTAGCVCVAAFAGCAKLYKGEYEYTQYGTNYGVKVEVRVDENKVIKTVRIVGSDYVDVSPAGGEYWTQENVNNWYDNVTSVLKAYEGRTVDEVLAIQVAVDSNAAPLGQSAEGFIAYDSELLISGATVGSSRLLLAVQNAIKDI